MTTTGMACPLYLANTPNNLPKKYIAPVRGIFSDALSTLAYMMLTIIMTDYFQSVSKTMPQNIITI